MGLHANTGHSSRNAEPLLTDIHQMARQAALGRFHSIISFLHLQDSYNILIDHFLYLDTALGLSLPLRQLKCGNNSIIPNLSPALHLTNRYKVAPLCFFASGGIAPHIPKVDAHTHTITNDDEFDKSVSTVGILY